MLRNKAAYVVAIGSDSIVAPTTTGDCCGRFEQVDIDARLLTINEIRLIVWNGQDLSFREQAIIDVDGVILATKGESWISLSKVVQNIIHCSSTDEH